MEKKIIFLKLKIAHAKKTMFPDTVNIVLGENTPGRELSA